jgi:hypothetical protein
MMGVLAAMEEVVSDAPSGFDCLFTRTIPIERLLSENSSAALIFLDEGRAIGKVRDCTHDDCITTVCEICSDVLSETYPIRLSATAVSSPAERRCCFKGVFKSSKRREEFTY